MKPNLSLIKESGEISVASKKKTEKSKFGLKTKFDQIPSLKSVNTPNRSPQKKINKQEFPFSSFCDYEMIKTLSSEGKQPGLNHLLDDWAVISIPQLYSLLNNYTKLFFRIYTLNFICFKVNHLTLDFLPYFISLTLLVRIKEKIMTIDEFFNQKQEIILNYILQSSLFGSRKWSQETKSHFGESIPKPKKIDFRKELKSFLVNIKKDFNFPNGEAESFEKNAKLLKKDQKQSSCCRVF